MAKKNARPVQYCGIEYKSLNDLFKSKASNGISYSSFLMRINKGWELERALKEKDNRCIPVQVNGVIYNNIRHAYYSLKPSATLHTVRDRLSNQWSAEDAFEIIDGRKTHIYNNHVIVNGTTYRSAMNAWKTIGKTSLYTYNYRKRNGYSLEVCLGFEKLPTLERYRYKLHGKTYNSIQEIARKYGLTTSQLSARLRRMSLEEAIDYYPLSGGIYCETIFKRNNDLAQSIGRLYFIRITFHKGILHKVGITQRDVSQRFNGFNFHTIAEYKGPLSLAYKIEQKVLKKFNDYRYRANDDFSGKTETFLLTDDKEAEVTRFISSLASIYGFSNA